MTKVGKGIWAALCTSTNTQVPDLYLLQMDPSGKSKGPPPAVKKVLGLFGSGKEEDRMVGYLSFLKIGPKLLRFLPGTLPPVLHPAITLLKDSLRSLYMYPTSQSLLP